MHAICSEDSSKLPIVRQELLVLSTILCVGDYNVSGLNFHWTDGVSGMALSPRREDGSKTLYFHAASGIHEFAVLNTVLMNESCASSDNYHLLQLAGEKGPKSQGFSSVYDFETGIIYFLQINQHGVACWDTKTSLNPSTFSKYLYFSRPIELH